MGNRRINLKSLSALLLLLGGAATLATLLLSSLEPACRHHGPPAAPPWPLAFLAALRLGDACGRSQPRPLPSYIGVPRGEPLRLRCGDCALVSSSGQMLGTGAGRDIDGAECVWRMNNAVLAPRYRADVGARASVRVVSHTSVPLLARAAAAFFGNGSDNTQGNATYVIWGPLKNMQRDPPGPVYRKILDLKSRFPWARIFTLTDEQMQRCDEMFKNETGKDRLKSGAYLSTGWFTMVLAMEVCDSIHVYGMIDDAYCSRPDHRTVPYHYYQPNGSTECEEYSRQEHARGGTHRFVTEKAVFGRWAAQRNVRFSHPEWPADGRV
ncbi:LOW QUALITY PROTEIN: alpha-N-acetylgalactosaminide alpha-2,6-sialyltransferase 3-like [Lethenteron reissneri]|uniref:LOW QUALITY PROTEIN: alpha-N-acetylgalactosaminide alpha-2,6-sialyltransferase 3-like n=1 Tax=Lethenteron reissneri TaxID=7753 RepID=UPI002AB6CDE5|nr:LOW QUALITY PROTEIN: alpha-N-acetylgalactosaminide alpha-2,6-sialyltransferase 3-like [Lethenteron reissneri]